MVFNLQLIQEHKLRKPIQWIIRQEYRPQFEIEDSVKLALFTNCITVDFTLKPATDKPQKAIYVGNLLCLHMFIMNGSIVLTRRNEIYILGN